MALKACPGGGGDAPEASTLFVIEGTAADYHQGRAIADLYASYQRELGAAHVFLLLDDTISDEPADRRDLEHAWMRNAEHAAWRATDPPAIRATDPRPQSCAPHIILCVPVARWGAPGTPWVPCTNAASAAAACVSAGCARPPPHLLSSLLQLQSHRCRLWREV